MKIISKKTKTYKYLCDDLLTADQLIDIQLNKMQTRNSAYNIYINDAFRIRLEKEIEKMIKYYIE